MKLWTVWSDYSATGEGRTLSACIVYANTAEQAISKFKTSIPGGDFYGLGAEAEEGVTQNYVTEYLFGKSTFSFCEKNDGQANIVAIAQLHFNFS